MGGGGGEGVHPDFFVKFDLEIEIERNILGPVTELLRGFRTPGARGTATPIFGLKYAKLCQITLTCSKPRF